MIEKIYPQKLIYIFSLVIFLFAGTLTAQDGSLKYIYTIDYPREGKAEFLTWVKSIANTLQEPKEIISIISYDNYFNVSPARVVEFEFASFLDAAKYFEREEIRKIVNEITDQGIANNTLVLKKRGDYSSGESKKYMIKYVHSLDYGVKNKSKYLSWVSSIASTLQKPELVKCITSYDNYFSSSPNRVIEFEFDSMQDAINYFEIPEIKSIIEESANRSDNHKLDVLRKRSDYNKN